MYCFSASSGVEEMRKFPDNFVFGVSTAAYQIEGAWNVADKSESIWDRMTHMPGKVADGSNGDEACDSYHLYKRDVEMLVELGVDFYRFSISWSRLLPTGFSNKISEDGLRYYNRVINEILANGKTPVITLYHFDLPQSLQDLGGWANPLMADYFVEYARVAFEEFGDRVKTWITFNEPARLCTNGYAKGTDAPGITMAGIANYLSGHTVLLAHAKVYHLYDDKYRPMQQGRISLALNADYSHAETTSEEDRQAAITYMQFETGWFAHPIYSKEGDYPDVMKTKIAAHSADEGYPRSRLPTFTPEEVAFIRGTFDFFGLNHYTSVISRQATNSSEGGDLDIYSYQSEHWPKGVSAWMRVVPWGFRNYLNWLRLEYDNPEVIIYENGYSDFEGLLDKKRSTYIGMYLNALLDAIEDGCNITGYAVWSLMDNFEWLSGFSESFGLYQVDFDDPRKTRTARASAMFFKSIIDTRSIEKIDIPHVPVTSLPKIDHFNALDPYKES